MTVGELAAYLATQDPTLEVLTRGYESGYAVIDPEGIRVIPVRRETSDWWRGPFVAADGAEVELVALTLNNTGWDD